MRTLCRDGTTDQFDDLVDRRNDRDIRKAALNLAPFVLDALPEAIRIALESLVQHAHNDKSSLAAIGGLCEILEEMDVDGVIGSTFQIFAQFVDNDENPALGTRFNLALQPLDDIAPVSGFHPGPLGPSVARLASDCGCDRFAQVPHRVAPPTAHRHAEPVFGRTPENGGYFGHIAKELFRFFEGRSAPERVGGKRKREARLAAAVRARPGERALAVCREAERGGQRIARRSLKYIAGEGIGLAKIGIDPDRSLVARGDRNMV
ncbi:hypothetical protein [Erythrobacter sp. HI0063]|uniref:hypothetical protein n=1 Tax=Erythrobacter sp. HI0063 TaxID=1822240 RepID=UPI001F4335B1|nr:hypothetical protein [Erythrobacter sp. HI0063]